MALALFLLFVVLPIAELYVIVQVAGAIGVLETLVIIVAFAFAGAWLCKRQGLEVLRRANDQLNRGEMPTGELVDGGLVLLAGSLMIVPGFITDAVGLALFLPPVRALLRRPIQVRLQRRLAAAAVAGSDAGFGFVRVTSVRGGFGGYGGDVFGSTPYGGDVLDVESYEEPDVPNDRPQLEGGR